MNRPIRFGGEERAIVKFCCLGAGESASSSRRRIQLPAGRQPAEATAMLRPKPVCHICGFHPGGALATRFLCKVQVEPPVLAGICFAAPELRGGAGHLRAGNLIARRASASASAPARPPTCTPAIAVHVGIASGNAIRPYHRSTETRALCFTA